MPFLVTYCERTPIGDWAGFARSANGYRSGQSRHGLPDQQWTARPGLCPCSQAEIVQWRNMPDTGRTCRELYEHAGDDFLCRVTAPINGITVRGSWLSDKVDTNVSFLLSLWSDVPKNAANSFSHPGESACAADLLRPPE